MSISSKKKMRPRTRALIAVCVTMSFMFVLMVLGTYLSSIAPTTNVSFQNGGVAKTEQPFYVLLIGSDSRVGTALYTGKKDEHAQFDEHADIMTLLRVDPATYTLTLVTIPRDTLYPGENYKINDSLLQGDPNKVVEAAEVLTGVNIDYFIKTDFINFVELIDGMGGIQIDVPLTIKNANPVTAKDLELKAGDSQHLDGEKTLVLARARKEYGDEQDAKRQVNVRSIEIAMFNRILQGSINPDAAVKDLIAHTESNMDWSLVETLISDFVANQDLITIYTCTGPYAGDTRPSDKLWIVHEDDATWEELMLVVESGEDPSDIVVEPTFTNDDKLDE